MQQTWKVLAPIDLADDPEAAVEHAIHAANAVDAELTLLYVASQRQPAGDNRLGWPQNALTAGRTPHGIRRRVLPGKPAEMIVRYAELSDADVILMASENCGGWKRFWKHSVTAEVMASSLRPLWIIDWKAVEDDFHFKCRTILCVLNLDGTDKQVVRQAESLALRSGGELILASAVPESGEHLLHEAIGGSNRPLSAQLVLERLGAIGGGLSVPYKTSVMAGSLNRCARLAAHQHSADIVVASSAEPRSMSTNAFDIRSGLRQLPCPVVAVPHNSSAARRRQIAIAEEPVLSKVANFRR